MSGVHFSRARIYLLVIGIVFSSFSCLMGEIAEEEMEIKILRNEINWTEDIFTIHYRLTNRSAHQFRSASIVFEIYLWMTATEEYYVIEVEDLIGERLDSGYSMIESAFLIDYYLQMDEIDDALSYSKVKSKQAGLIF